MQPEQQTETFVVYGSHYWGKGSTVEEAKKVFRAHGGQLSKGYAVMSFDAQTTFHGIDDFGRYHYDGNPPTETVHPPRGKKS